MPRKGEQSGMPAAYLMYCECYNECSTNVDITLKFRPTAPFLTRFFQSTLHFLCQSDFLKLLSNPNQYAEKRFDEP